MELTALRDALSSHKNSAITQAIRGLGGQGKSSLAVEYAFRCHEGEAGYPSYDYILWTRADSTTDLLTGYAKIAEVIPVTSLKPEDQQQVAADVRKWLETNESWLLIYDNADEPDLLEALRPRNANGHILLTSRAHSFKGYLGIKHPIELRSLRPKDAIAFLFDRTIRKPEEESTGELQAVADLAEHLGYFPLALEQAAAYIAAEDISFASYLAEFRKREQELLNEAAPETGDYRNAEEQEYKTIRTTWDLNFQAVEKENPATAELLRFAAFLAPDEIPYVLIIAGAGELGSPLSDVFANLSSELDHIKACDRLLRPLLRYSLVEKNGEHHAFSVHRMVQSVQRDRLQTSHLDRVGRAVSAVCTAFPNPEFGNWDWCATLLPHALACLNHARQNKLETDETALLLNRAGTYLSDRGLYFEAKPLYEKALDILQRVSPHDHAIIAISMNNMAGLYTNLARYEQAEPLYKQALAIQQTALPEEHLDIASSLNNLASLYATQGRYAEAETLYQQVLAIRQKTWPEGYQDIAMSLSNLAALYNYQGRYKEAKPLLQQALSLRRKALPEDHPDIAISLNNLAISYNGQGQHAKAEPLFKEALAIRRTSLPEGHPEIGKSLGNLAGTYNSQRRYTEAEPLFHQALAIVRNALPAGHPEIADTLNNLAGLYYEQGQYGQAGPLFEEALAMRRKSLREDHPDLGISLGNLAGLYMHQKRFTEAEPLYEQALDIRQKALPEGHPDIANILNNLASLYESQGRYVEAEPLYEEATENMVRALGLQHPNTQGVLNNYVGFMTKQGRQEKAIEFLRGLGMEYPQE